MRTHSRGWTAAAEPGGQGDGEKALVMRSEGNRPGPAQGPSEEEETESHEGVEILLWNGQHGAAGWAGVTS